MADFRNILNATALTALLAGLSVPAVAQTCNAGSVLPPDMRTEGHAELVGDILITCVGGSPTPPGSIVPPVNIRIQLNTFITSQLLGTDTSLLSNEALLIVDEPNSGRYQPNVMTANATGERGLLACGAAGAPDSSPSGANVCRIVAPNHPSRTYDGQANGTYVVGVSDNTALSFCGGGQGLPAAGAYGCGRPNVFQAHYLSQQSGARNIIEFSGVPFDPPGNIELNNGLPADNPNRIPWVRTFRIVNIRVDAAATNGDEVKANVAISGNTQASINNADNILVARNRFPAFLAPVVGGALSFVQCIEKNISDQSLTGIRQAPRSFATNNGMPFIRFTEGFEEAWKVRGWAQIQANSTTAGNLSRYGNYSETFNTGYGTYLRQNVPGAIYHTESGFAAPPAPAADPAPVNPPVTAGFQSSGLANQSIENGADTGIDGAGIATSGTRLEILFAQIPSGVTLYTPSVVYLTRKGSDVVTGIAMLNTRTPGDRRNNLFAGGPSPTTWSQVPADNIAVYEMFYVDPFAEEDMTVPIGIQTNLLQLPQSISAPTTVRGGLSPVVGPTEAHVPLYVSNSFGNLPRFTENLQGGQTLFTLDKCNCNLLFPFVSNAAHFDTGFAIANTSKDPANASITGTDRDVTGTYTNTLAQDGPIKLWYFGKNAGTNVIFTQTSNQQIQAGTVATFSLAAAAAPLGLGAIQTAANNSTNAAYTDFSGYVIAKASFQYCHGFAFFSNKNLANVTGLQGTSVGYLALVMDPTRFVGTYNATSLFGGVMSLTNPNARTTNVVSDGLDQ